MKTARIEVSTRRTFQGAIECSAVIGTRYVHMQYFGYPKREAIRLFRAWIKAGAE